MIPFFVADRPMSLRILKTSGVHSRDIVVGLMGHANTTINFQNLMRIYPCETVNCPLSKHCPYPNDICKQGQRIKERTIRMCDSGVFTKEGCMPTGYEELFSVYENMKINYGIIIDVLKNKDETIKSAKKALITYNKGYYSFNLVGVIQGDTVEEYIECYEELLCMGYKYIAVGGLLKKVENSARYTRVRDEKLLKEVLISLREIYPKNWLYALGSYHPKRHKFFEDLNLFGSDSKGWIFNYKKIDSKDILSAREHRFKQVHSYIQENIYQKLKVDRRSRAIIVGCSKIKRRDRKLIPAIERYDGSVYKILRNYLGNGGSQNKLDILIISAKYGLIKDSSKISYYNQIMNKKRAKELNVNLVKELNEYLTANKYPEIFINLGEMYLSAIEGFRVPHTQTKITYAEGRIGERLAEMKNWLYQKQ